MQSQAALQGGHACIFQLDYAVLPALIELGAIPIWHEGRTCFQQCDTGRGRSVGESEGAEVVADYVARELITPDSIGRGRFRSSICLVTQCAGHLGRESPGGVTSDVGRSSDLQG